PHLHSVPTRRSSDLATTFYGTAIGLPVTYSAGNVAMYNDQGFLMQTLDSPGAVWSITPGDSTMSDVLGYWRHEFATYKQQHQQLDRKSTRLNSSHVS